MKIRWAAVIGVAGFIMTASRPLSAGEPARLMPVRVTWVRPDLVPARQRMALTRLLVAAAAGQSLSGVRVRDSRPQINSRWAAGLGHTETEVRLRHSEIVNVYPRHP